MSLINSRNGSFADHTQHTARLHAREKFLGHAYMEGKKFLSHIDNYAGIAKNIIGAVAPVVGQMSGPIGTAVGAAVGGEGLKLRDGEVVGPAVESVVPMPKWGRPISRPL